MFDRRIDALHERERHEACQIDRVGRPRERKASFTHVHVELFLEALAHAVDGDLHRWFDVARKRRQELLFERSRLRPVLKADESDIRVDQFVAGSIDERNGFRLEPFDRERGEGTRLFDAKLLRLDLSARRRGKCGQPQQQGGRLRGAHHGVLSIGSPIAPDISGIDTLRCLVFAPVGIARRRGLVSRITPVRTVLAVVYCLCGRHGSRGAGT